MTADSLNKDLQQCRYSSLLLRGYKYGRSRRISLKLAFRLEGGEFFSATARKIFEEYHGVSIGAYSYGGCFIAGAFDRNAKIGRYVSIGPGVRVFLRNHPLDRLSLHPFFYNSKLGWIKEETNFYRTLTIEHDSWLGANSLVTPGCSRIGVGAVVAAGAVVTKDVPDFAVVAGNPAKILRFRFSPETMRRVLQSKWWERSIEECSQFMDDLTRPLEPIHNEHPLLSA
jgi:virginiamycin A acetyltransferase